MRQGRHSANVTGKHKNNWMIAICVVVVLLVIAICIGINAVNGNHTVEGTATQTPSDHLENSEPPVTVSAAPGTPQPQVSVQVETSPEESSAPAVIVPPQESTNVEVVQEITFPYTVPNTQLVIEELVSYDGIFLEDGSDTEISGVTAMILKNTGTSDIEYVDLTLERSGVTLTFQASAIPAGGRIVVQEANKTPYQSGGYANCQASVAYLDHFERSETQVKVEDLGNSTLKITNLTQEKIPCVRIFYKFYLEEKEAYIGGIAYTAKITDLEAGASVEVSPTHYVSGSSQILMIRTYSSAED